MQAERMSEADYLARERAATTKHELVNGQMIAMSGASPRHNAICANLVRALGNLVRGGPCAVLTSDQRVHVTATGLFSYPDVTVVCGEMRFHAKDDHTLLTPTLIVEVLSPSTEAYDRGAKFHHYQSIPTLSEILLVASEERQVDHYRRVSSQPNRFELISFADDSLAIPLPGLSATLSFLEIYEGTERFPL